MAKKATHSHRRLVQSCKDCQKLQKTWYEKLKKSGFIDIEFGRENPRFIAKSAASTIDEDYYAAVWQVYHTWRLSGRCARDLRVCELLAEQKGSTGTVRGISWILKKEKLVPWSPMRVQSTLKEITKAVIDQINEKQMKSIPYIELKHKAA